MVDPSIGPVPLDPPAIVQTASARSCGAEMRARLLAPPRPDDDSVALDCSLRLGPGDRVLKRIVLRGSAASGVEIACGGATIGRAEPPPTLAEITVEIRSVPPPRDGGRWDRPSGITIRDCTILGHVRVWGMGVNGQGEAVRASSRSPGHTARAQAAAPTDVAILNSRITGFGPIPLYLAPGVTRFTFRGSTLDGRSAGTALYLDAESADNVIEGNTFAVATAREIVALDGSAGNRVTGNRIALGGRDGVHLYRNCGEGGTVRHQTPSDNVVTGNVFTGGGVFGGDPVRVNARGGWRLYCGQDAGYPFGSSADDSDGGTGNVVAPNRVE